MNARTDVHRPSAPEFDPEGYECYDVYDLHPREGDYRELNRELPKIEARGYHFAVIGSHDGILEQCIHCGAHLRYAALMLHAKTMTYGFVGEQCLANRFTGMTSAQFKALRERAALNRERTSKTAKIAALCEEHPLLTWLTYPVYFNAFVGDVGGQMLRNGELSERQIATVERSIVQETERSDERSAQRAQLTRAPGGKVRVTGTVLSTKEKETDWGWTLKMLVMDDRQFKVWITVPSALNVEKGDRVAFFCTLKPSADDPSFAFGSRPTKAEKLEKES